MKERKDARKVFSDNLQRLLEYHSLNQNDIVERLGVSSATASDWVRGNKYPRVDAMQALANMLDVSMAQLVNENQDDFPLPSNIVPIHRRMIPVLGNVAAGQPIWADEEHDEYVDDNGTKGADFALRVKGDSMSPLIEDGDFVYVHRQPTVRNGQIAVVIDGDSATLKYVYINNDGVQLASHNPKYAPMVYTGDAAAQLHIAGLAIAYRRSLIQK